MKKIFLLAICMILLCSCENKPERIALVKEHYNKAEIIGLDENGFIDLENNKKTFLLFIYMPGCTTSASFEKVVKEFSNNNNITLYSLSWIAAKNTSIGQFLEYYPSFIIYKDGQMVDFLDAGSNDDLDYYLTTEGLETWLNSYVDLKNGKTYSSTSSKNHSESSESNLMNSITLDSRLEEVEKHAGKVNVYLFWGSGCPHCKNAIAYLDSITEEYGKYFNLYTFEVWNSQENSELMLQFAKKMGDTPNGVPYIIIGEQTFNGFSDDMKSKILSAIKTERRNDFDVYLND